MRFIPLCIKNTLLLLFIINSRSDLYSQSQALNIGQQVPEIFWKVIPRTDSAELYLLDFWNVGCSSCIDAFPHIRKLQEQFPGKLKLILVNSWENDAEIKKKLGLVNANRKKHGVDTARIPDNVEIINKESVLIALFPCFRLPQHVWVNKSGEVLAITTGHNATQENVRAVLNGQRVNFEIKNDSLGTEVRKNGIIQSGIPAVSSVYYSAFIPYFPGVGGLSNHVDRPKNTFRRTFYNFGPIEHIKKAFSSEIAENRIIFGDTNCRKYLRPVDSTQQDEWNRKFSFTYQLQGKLEYKDNWQKIMQGDLNQFFGNMFGLAAEVETRKCRTFVLVNRHFSHTDATGKPMRFIEEGDTLIFSNYAFRGLIDLLRENLEDVKENRVLIDETGIDRSSMINMVLSGDLTNVQHVRKIIKRYGLDLLEEERTVKVLVIGHRKE